MISIELILNMYMFLCTGMIIFNLVVWVWNRLEFDNRRYRSHKLEAIIRKEVISGREKQYVINKLKKKDYLLQYYSDIPQMKDASSIFSRLAVYYKQSPDIDKAYFAYILSNYRIETQPIISFLMTCIVSQSIYSRENALKALYAIGNEKHIVNAYRLLSRNRLVHHHKLLCDGLISSDVKPDSVLELLWYYFDEFSVEIQVAIIDYSKIMKLDYRGAFYQMLVQKKNHKEVELALIRYFGKHKYEPAKNFMIHILTSEENTEWEYDVNIARELKYYSDEDSIKALKQALRHHNWHVRLNAAESLCDLEKFGTDIGDIDFRNNLYGQEILTYIRKKKIEMEMEDKTDGSYESIS